MRSATLARFVLLEARRSGLMPLALSCVALALVLAAFLSQVALTEGRELQVAIVAALLRAAAVFVIAVYVTSSTLREINDKGLEVMLAFALPRAIQYAGRLAGFAACGALLAVAFALPLLAWASPAAVAA